RPARLPAVLHRLPVVPPKDRFGEPHLPSVATLAAGDPPRRAGRPDRSERVPAAASPRHRDDALSVPHAGGARARGARGAGPAPPRSVEPCARHPHLRVVAAGTAPVAECGGSAVGSHLPSDAEPARGGGVP